MKKMRAMKRLRQRGLREYSRSARAGNRPSFEAGGSGGGRTKHHCQQEEGQGYCLR